MRKWVVFGVTVAALEACTLNWNVELLGDGGTRDHADAGRTSADGGKPDAASPQDAAPASDGASAPADDAAASSRDAALAAGDGGGEADAGQPGPNLMFVTSQTFHGDLGGLAGADAKCRAAAQAQGLKGTFVALLSATGSDALSRLGSARGWVRRDGKPFADTVNDLKQRKFFYPPRIDETGKDVGSAFVFSGSTENGALAAGQTCSDWTVGASNARASAGFADGGASGWMTGGQPTCSSMARLFCFGVDRAIPVTAPKQTGRYAFVSMGTFSPDTGVAAADGLCQQEGSTLDPNGTFHALIADVGTSPKVRFDTSQAPWVRPDGLRITESATQMFNVALWEAPIVVRVDGAHLFNPTVYMGSTGFSASGTASTTCGNWSNTSGTVLVGSAWRSSVPDIFSDASGTIPCGPQSWALLCLQD
jgi:hypothetical protein